MDFDGAPREQLVLDEQYSAEQRPAHRLTDDNVDTLAMEFRADGRIFSHAMGSSDRRNTPSLMRRGADAMELSTTDLLSRTSELEKEYWREKEGRAATQAEDSLIETSRLLALASNEGQLPNQRGLSFEPDAYSALQGTLVTSAPALLSKGEDTLNVRINQRDLEYIESAAKDAAATRDTFAEPPERPPHPAIEPGSDGLIRPSMAPLLDPLLLSNRHPDVWGQMQPSSAAASGPYPPMSPMMSNYGGWPPRATEAAPKSDSNAVIGFGIGGALVLVGLVSGLLIWYFKVREQKGFEDNPVDAGHGDNG